MNELKKSTEEFGEKQSLSAVPWMRDPVDINLTELCSPNFLPFLDPRLKMALHNIGITELFQTQVAVWHETIGPGSFERDLCIRSPTGTGKTLSYVLPIVQILSTRIVKCLRALVVVHTRVLAEQVKRVFDKFAPAVGLSVGLAVGQSSIEDEISSLIKKPVINSSVFYDPEYIPPKPTSSVDILVATPGRLMEHINNTHGFTLEHLQYLVVDEADRLLRESYQSWLLNVLELADTKNQNQFSVADNNILTLRTIRSFGVERGFKGKPHPRLVKIALSATITDNPSKIAPLDLHHPLLLMTKQRLPEQLKSYKVEFKSELKQLYLLALLESLQKEKCIVFKSSPQSADKLCTLLNSLDDLQIKIGQYSSEKQSKQRYSSEKHSIKSKTTETTLSEFRTGKIQVLISHNKLARGMDIEGLQNVINYDMPKSLKNYIHQAGRTARAGNTGRCFTFLDIDKVKVFKSMLEKAAIKSCPVYRIQSEYLESVLHRYSAAVETAEKHRNSKPFLLRCRETQKRQALSFEMQKSRA